VVDTGHGLDAAARAYVAKAAQVDPDADSASPLSLGLRISTALVREMDGRLSIRTSEVQSLIAFFAADWNAHRSQECGTRVTFVLPMRVDQALVDSGLQSPAKGRPLCILVVEDIPEMMYVFRLYLQGTPYSARVASTGQQALALYSSSEYDVVLLDRYLPDMDGLEVAGRIRGIDAEQHRQREADLIMISAAVSAEHEQEARASGIRFFEPKPLTRSRLLEMLGQIAVSRTPLNSPRTLSPPPGDSRSSVTELMSLSRVNIVRHRLWCVHHADMKRC
jgi:CheY-like chemotaxis protein